MPEGDIDGDHTSATHDEIRRDCLRWEALPRVGFLTGDEDIVELRQCMCGSTIGRRIPSTHTEEEEDPVKFQIYQDETGEYRWRLVSANHRIVADSGESYTRHEDAYRAIATVQTAVATAMVVDAGE